MSGLIVMRLCNEHFNTDFIEAFKSLKQFKYK